MAPKSVKLRDKFLWYSCDKCGIKLMQANVKNHEKNCEKSVSYVEEEKFYSTSLNFSIPSEVELQDIPKSHLQKYVFIPESICSFTGLIMGCNVLIDFGGSKKYVRTLWTVSDALLDVLHTVSEEIKHEFQNKTEVHLIISKFPGRQVKIAKQIELETDQSTDYSYDVAKLLKRQLRNSILHKSNRISINFFNKLLSYQIKSFNGNTSAEDLVQQFENITISDQFYLVDSASDILISGEISVCDPGDQQPKKPLQTLIQVGGCDHIIDELKKSMDLALGLIENDSCFKISRGALLYGISGIGKSLICEGLANNYPSALKIRIEASNIFSKFYGESEVNLKKVFNQAFQNYPSPTVMIIDELYNICPKNDSTDAVKRISTLLVSLIESLHTRRDGGKIFILANTSNIDNIDPTIRRSGRLDFETEIPVPIAAAREEILKKLLQRFKSTTISTEKLKYIAKHTHGFVGADLENLLAKSVVLENKSGKYEAILEYSTILQNMSQVKPSAMRELLIEKPDVKWSDIGGQDDLKLKLKQIVEWPINHPETFERLGITPPRGLLMFGPPGCSKTMIAKALATESNLNFISIKGSDLFSMWVGESEKAVRELFQKARQLSPCIVFFDEIDAIGGERSASSGSSVKERVLAQILTEIDGVNTLRSVIIIAATNRPDLIDSALMRPGRLDRIVYVQLPDLLSRKEIFKIKLENIPVAADVDVEQVVKLTEGYSGAEINAVCKEAALKALEESFEALEVSRRHFDHALQSIKPRTSKELLEIYAQYLNHK